MTQFTNSHAATAIRIGSTALFIASIAAVMGSLPVPQAATVATAVPVAPVLRTHDDWFRAGVHG